MPVIDVEKLFGVFSKKIGELYHATFDDHVTEVHRPVCHSIFNWLS